MTALPGGAADKAGNSYEQLWTALRVADLLRGDASCMQLEPVGDDGLGVEFLIELPEGTWGEQTKHSASSWTIKRLRDEGALAAAKYQIDRGRGYRLVTSSAAVALDKLAHRARSTTSLTQFESALPEKLQPDFDAITAHWMDSREVAWSRLQKITVEHHPFMSLRLAVRQAFEVLYAGEPEVVLGVVSKFCGEHVHRSLRAPEIATHLRGLGFIDRLLAGDKNTRRLLHQTVERQQRRVHASAPEAGFVHRTEIQEIVHTLLAEDCPPLILIDAPAGYGKTAVATEVARVMEEQGWHVAVARLDNATAVPTSRHMGEHMGLTESPSVLLAGAANGGPGLLVVDQLDAVSLFSGRMPDNFDAVAEIIAELDRLNNVKVLLACRSADVENDPRLRALVRVQGATRRHNLERLDAEHLRTFLTAHNVRVEAGETMELLRTPVHLATYLLLSQESRTSTYRTLQDLYDRLTSDVRRRAQSRAGALDWQGITTCMVTSMSDKETLTVRKTALGAFATGEVAALESEGLLTSDGSGVSFFHETYFDYLFARAFVERGGDLHDFLSKSGQFLFRRAQTRQVLEYLAGTDRRRFREVATELLTSSIVRSHLKHVVVGVLRQIAPEPDDWRAIEGVAWSSAAIGPHLVAVLSDAGWFDAADQLGRWEGWLADPERVARAAHQMTFAARHHGTRVAELARPYIGANEEWRVRMRALISWSLNSELVPLAVELIEGGQLDDARGPIAVNSDFWSIIHMLLRKDPVGAARVTGAYLRRGIHRSRAENSGDPFESGKLSTRSTHENLFADIATRAPLEFLEEVVPFVVEVAMVDQHALAGHLPHGRRWGLRWRGTRHSVDDALFEAVELALVTLAVSQPEVVRTTIQPLRDINSEELRFLTCRALTALEDSDEAIRWLIEDPRNLVLGWADNPRWASRELVASHSSRCSADLYERLEVVIIGYSSPLERKPLGYGQFTLMSGLDPERLSQQGRRRLAELGRKFHVPPSAPRGIEASFVGSPIPDDATKKMTDDNWLAALRKHDSEGTDWTKETPVGGARELAQVLERRAKDAPERFARLALRFDNSIPATAGVQLLRGVRAGIDLALLADVCDHLSALYGDDVGREICSAIHDADGTNARLVALIERYSLSTDPDRDGLFGADLFMAGLNCTRGGAALAAASVLFGTQPFLSELTPVVKRLARDPVLAVRTCGANAVTALLNHDSDHALSLAEALFETSVDVMDARTTERLLTYCVIRSPAKFSAQLGRTINGPDPIARRGGRVWAIAESQGALRGDLPVNVDLLPPAARAGAAEVLAGMADDRAEWLAKLFDDPDPDVRAAASKAMRNIADLSGDSVDPLIEAFVRSSAFSDHMEHLFHALESLATRLPSSTLEACAQAVKASAHEFGDIRTASAGLGQDLITIVLRLYRQGDEPTRAACLDIIDRLTDANAYGIEEALAEER